MTERHPSYELYLRCTSVLAAQTFRRIAAEQRFGRQLSGGWRLDWKPAIHLPYTLKYIVRSLSSVSGIQILIWDNVPFKTVPLKNLILQIV